MDAGERGGCHIGRPMQPERPIAQQPIAPVRPRPTSLFEPPNIGAALGAGSGVGTTSTVGAQSPPDCSDSNMVVKAKPKIAKASEAAKKSGDTNLAITVMVGVAAEAAGGYFFFMRSKVVGSLAE